jgi:hypothetical protein
VREAKAGGSGFAFCVVMANARPLRNYAGRKLARRLTRSIPYIGAVIAVATLASAIRRKGFVRGLIHSGLDAIPFVGGAKNVAEVVRGRDFFPDRVRPQ